MSRARPPSATEGPTTADRRRVRTILNRLRKRYGDLQPPRAVDPLDELILTVLSQHTSDLNAERAFADLRRAFPRGWAEVEHARTQAVADAIRSGGLANSKAPRIQAILREVHEREGSYDLGRLSELSDAEARAYLMTLPGIGPKTAAVVLSFALGRDAIPVDTHVEATRPDPAQGLGGARRSPLARPRARGPPHPAARGADPPGPRDLQGAHPAVSRVPPERHLSHRPAVPEPMRAR